MQKTKEILEGFSSESQLNKGMMQSLWDSNPPVMSGNYSEIMNFS